MKVTQLIANALNYDAVTQYSIKLHEALISRNVESEIIAFNGVRLHQDMRIASALDNEFAADILIYHHSIGSPASEVFRNASGVRKILCYHNITPEVFFRPYSDALATLVREGRADLKAMSHLAETIVADSAFNAGEILCLGFENVKVVPVPVNLSADYTSSARRPGGMLNSGKNFLFVGRIAPNKCFEKLIDLFEVYCKTIAPAKLFLVGDTNFLPVYTYHLQKLISAKSLSEKIVFTGQITDQELGAFFKFSDAFICMSGHEGFCVPVLEAFYAGLPVFAAAKTAVPETMGNSGVQFLTDDVYRNAELINYVLNDSDLLTKIRQRSRERYESLTEDNFCDYWFDILGVADHSI